MKIWEHKAPGNLWATMGLLGEDSNFLVEFRSADKLTVKGIENLRGPYLRMVNSNKVDLKTRKRKFVGLNFSGGGRL